MVRKKRVSYRHETLIRKRENERRGPNGTEKVLQMSPERNDWVSDNAAEDGKYRARWKGLRIGESVA